LPRRSFGVTSPVIARAIQFSDSPHFSVPRITRAWPSVPTAQRRVVPSLRQVRDEPAVDAEELTNSVRLGAAQMPRLLVSTIGLST
jgi:hypothetical protein